MNKRYEKGASSSWLIGILAGFAVVIAVNIAMVTLAINSSRGEIEENSYEKGMAFQETIDKRAFIDSRGIRIEASLKDNASAEKTEATINIKNEGELFVGRALRLELRRPAERALDRQCTLTLVQRGDYECSFDRLPGGLYLMTLLLGDEGRVDRELILQR